MAVQTSLPALLHSLSQSLNSALEATPKLATIEHNKDGVSLLDVKNELLLSYLQNLVFLILLKIRNAKSGQSSSDSDEDDKDDLSDTVVKKLVELRLYLEKGVRPLEEKLRFQLDKILRAADNADRNTQQAEVLSKAKKLRDEEFESGSEGDEEEEDGLENRPTKDLAAAKNYTPGAHGFIPMKNAIGIGAASSRGSGSGDNKTGAYRPPKITPTVMPTTNTPFSDRRERAARPTKSATMDEYVSHELSSAPLAMPSVGADILRRGRGVKTATQRAEEDRRRDYEESNFVRLPKESKKERARKARSEGSSAKMSFGGEEWRELGAGADRVSRMTGRKPGASGGGGTRALLEKSRKRGRDTADSARGSGLNSGTMEIGERFNKKVKVMEGGRRDRGKR